MGFHASTCSSVKMPGVLGSLQANVFLRHYGMTQQLACLSITA
jgi:hypothetical protein